MSEVDCPAQAHRAVNGLRAALTHVVKRTLRSSLKLEISEFVPEDPDICVRLSSSLWLDNGRPNERRASRRSLTLLHCDGGYLWLGSPINTVMVLGCTPLCPPCTDSRNVCFEALLFRAVRFRCQLHESVQGYFHPWRFRLR